MKVNSSNVKKIKKDASEKGDLCAGVEETQGLNKELVLLEAGKAFVDGIFTRMKDILGAPSLSEEVKQLKEEISALKNELANKEKPNNNNVISGDDFDENDEDLEKLLKEISKKGASQTISDNNIDGRSKDARFIKDMDATIKQIKEDSLSL